VKELLLLAQETGEFPAGLYRLLARSHPPWWR
jgi:hypothetical protein